MGKTLSVGSRTLLTLAILGMAGITAAYLVTHPAQTKKKEAAKKHTVLVETVSVTPGAYPVEINAMGEVVPARAASVKARVSGEVVHIAAHFMPGGFFTQGQEMLRIDPADYELTVRSRKAALRQAQAALQLEEGEQAIARDELSIIEKSTGKKLQNRDLALRKPQMEQARANLDSAGLRWRRPNWILRAQRSKRRLTVW